MSYILNGSTIRRPKSFDEQNSTQVAQQRTLNGAINRDYFGSNKTIGSYNYENCNPTDFNTINTIYQNYLTTGSTVTWQISDTNYNGRFSTARNVHVDLVQRGFTVSGSDYLSNFTLVLTEA